MAYNKNAITLPAGTYYVGDPCYAFDYGPEGWSKVIELTDCFNIPATRIDGKYVVGFGTAYGDGSYTGSDGFDYGVDAGLIGAVHESIAQANALDSLNKVTFDAPFQVWAHDGVITIGHIVIDTNYEDEEEEEEEYEDEAEEEEA